MNKGSLFKFRSFSSDLHWLALARHGFSFLPFIAKPKLNHDDRPPRRPICHQGSRPAGHCILLPRPGRPRPRLVDQSPPLRGHRHRHPPRSSHVLSSMRTGPGGSRLLHHWRLWQKPRGQQRTGCPHPLHQERQLVVRRCQRCRCHGTRYGRGQRVDAEGRLCNLDQCQLNFSEVRLYLLMVIQLVEYSIERCM